MSTKHNEVRVVFPDKSHTERLIAACVRHGIACGTAMRVAMEWHSERVGDPLPTPNRRHAPQGAVSAESILKHGLTLRVPECWVEHVGASRDAIRKRAIAATIAWLDAGAPPDNIRRVRFGVSVGRVPGDEERMLQVHVRLHGADRLVRADAIAAKLSSSGICRRIIAAAYRAQTGETLPSISPRTWTVGPPASINGQATFNIGMSQAWADNIGALCNGDVNQWCRAAILRHYGVDESKTEEKPARPARAKVNRLPEFVAQCNDRSTWPAGLGVASVKIGSITGRPFVSAMEVTA